MKVFKTNPYQGTRNTLLYILPGNIIEVAYAKTAIYQQMLLQKKGGVSIIATFAYFSYFLCKLATGDSQTIMQDRIVYT